MTRFLADEDFNNDILRGLLRRVAVLDIVRVQDIGFRGADDDAVLARAASEERVVLTHDVSTLVARAFERMKSGMPMPGVIAIAQSRLPGHLPQREQRRPAKALRRTGCTTNRSWGRFAYPMRMKRACSLRFEPGLRAA